MYRINFEDTHWCVCCKYGLRFCLHILLAQRCWWGCKLYERHIWLRDSQNPPLQRRIQVYTIEQIIFVENVYWLYFWRYFLWTHRWLYVVITTKVKYGGTMHTRRQEVKCWEKVLGIILSIILTVILTVILIDIFCIIV